MIEQIEELGAEAHGDFFLDAEFLTEAAGDDGTALAAEIVKVGDVAAGDAGGLILPSGGVEDGFLGGIDAAAVDVLEIERDAGDAILAGVAGGDEAADGVVRARGVQQGAALPGTDGA